MDIRPIRTDEDHAAALAEIERLWGACVGTPEGDRLDVLATLAEAYELKRWPIDAPDPIEPRPRRDAASQPPAPVLRGIA